MASVTYEGVTKRFGDVVAVQDLNIEVADKEFLVFVGPSGCGKTTSLRLLAGLEEIDEGKIYIGNDLVNDTLPKDRDIAMVFQNYALYPHMSVYDNLSFALKLRHTPKAQIDERVKEAATILAIDHLLNRKPKQLSGGERQRVALGRAIVRHPKVFLMDEPLSNLDAKLRVQTRAQLIKLHDRLQATFVYVTHDQVEAMTMGSRIAVMNKGFLQQVDTPQNLYDHPANIFVAGFIGSPAMNFFNARITGTDGDMMVETKSFTLRVPGEKAQLLQDRTGQEVIFGIRPEDLHLPGDAPREMISAPVQAQLDVKEPMGNEIFLHFASPDGMFEARVSPRSTINVGDQVELMMDTNKMHIFDKETEQAIT